MTRSLFVFLFVFSVLFAAPAMAADSYWKGTWNGYTATSVGPGEPACIAAMNKAIQVSGASYTFVDTHNSTDPSTSVRCWGKGSNGVLTQYGSASKQTCPSATPYFDAAALACTATPPPPPPPDCPMDKPGVGSWWAGKTGGENPTNVFVSGGCVGGCVVKMTGVNSCHSYSDGNDYCSYNTMTTGSTCTASGGMPAPANPPADSAPPRTDVPPITPPPGQGCPAGTVQGGVSSDGVPICIGTGSDPKNSPPPAPKVESEKSEPTPDGGTKTTHTSTTTNSDGSTTTTTTTTTTAPDGSKTTTVDKNTSTNLAGGAGKDESNREDEKYDLCKQNPNLTICRNSSVAGTCGQISCQGDAIQCATLRAAAAMQCQQQSDIESLKTMPAKALGEAILGGAESEASMLGDLVKGTEVDMSKPNIDQSSFVAASCFANRSINVLGQSVEMDFTRVCNDIQPLRAAIMAVAFLVAYLIVARSVLQS